MPGNQTSAPVQHQSADFPKPSTSSAPKTVPEPGNAHHVQKTASSRQSKTKPENIHIHHPPPHHEGEITPGRSSVCGKQHGPQASEHRGGWEERREVGRQRSTSRTPVPEDQAGETAQEPERSRSCDGETPSSSSNSSTSTITEKIDTALHTLKSELTAMREQDLQLLKQLIHINDNIRRLKRARWLQRGCGRTVSCGLLGARTPTATAAAVAAASTAAASSSSSSAAAAVGLRSRAAAAGNCGGPWGPGVRVSMLQRQRSEPGLLGVPCFARTAVTSLTSTSSSFETIEDEDEEADSLYGSFSDLPSDTSPASSPFSPTKPPSLPTTPLLRTSPCAYTSLTFTQEELWRGESSYGEILKRNVRLWKWSVAREKEAGVVDGHHSHPCVL